MRKIAKASTITVMVAALVGCSSGEQSARQPAASAQAGGQSQNVASSAEYAGQNQLAAQPKSAARHGRAPYHGMADSAHMYRQPPQAGPDAMTFKNYGTNPFISTDEDNLSTFAADVDTGSYTLTRSYIQDGALPPADAVRTEEFINYFPASYPAPKQQTFGIQVDGGPSPFGPGYQLVRIGIKGKEVAPENRKPAHLVFVIDVSGSMEREDRLELVKRSLRVLVDQLQPEDTVGIVVYGSQGRVILDPTSAENRQAILSAIDSLTPEGSTNAKEGLLLGYEMANRSYKRGAINRVILCSDGVANVGETRASGILRSIEDYARKDIHLSTFGFGMGNYNDVLMEQLADKGEGQYAYIDSFSEARRVFTEALTGTLQTIARDVKIQVEFDPAAVDRYRLIGYENRDVRDEDFRNDRTDAGEIGAGHTVTALYEVKVKNGAAGKLGDVRIRYQNVSSQKVEEVSKPVTVQAKLSGELQFLAAVAEFAEILRESYWAKDSSLRDVLKLAESSAAREEQLEFVRMVKDSIAIRGD
ncbi:von Willebrand factor type A domain-containing protein [Brevibacillus sp. GCM10020057]|uniref:vWA domain-containing protein n=1 Tax=Brevibacillus sp. GCM10020057 TaxID=3317327 RepID=UPI00362B985A